MPDGGIATHNTGYVTPDAGTGEVIGIVYLDLNTNGVFNVTDTPLAGVSVAITDTNGVVTVVSTSPGGFYSLIVDAGLTVVNVLTNDPAFPPEAIVTVGTSNPRTVTVPSDGTVRDDKGFRLLPGTGLVQGVVYIDEDNNGLYEPGVDSPIPDITINITDANGVVRPVVTDFNGFYTLTVTNGIATVNVDTSGPDFPAELHLTTDAYGEGSNPSAVLVPNGGAATANTGYSRLNRVPPDSYVNLGLYIRLEPGAVVVYWSTNYEGFTLESTTNLPAGSTWTPVGGPYFRAGPNFEYRESRVALAPQKYFRLHYPGVLLLTPPEPQVEFHLEPDAAVLNWPPNYVGYTLVATTNLSPPALWTPLEGPYLNTNGVFEYRRTLPGPPQEFYRLP